MKVRIKGNSLRFRLSEEDLEQFAQQGSVVSTIEFGPDLSQQLRFSLESSSDMRIHSTFTEQQITVFIPEETARLWTSTDLITLKGTQPIDQHRQLSLLIEKDLPCEHPKK